MIQKILKDLIKYIPAKAVPGLVGILSLPLITRLLDPAEFGNYVLVTATTSIFSIFIGWLSMSIIRFYPIYQKEEQLDTFYNTVLILIYISIIFTTIFFMITIYLLRNRFPDELNQLMRIGVLLLFVTALFTAFIEFYRAKRKITLYSITTAWKSVTAIVFGVILILYFGFRADGLIWGQILSLTIIMPFLWKKSIGTLFINFHQFSSKLTKEIASYGFPLVAGNLAAWILSLSDRYFLQFYRGGQEVGIYSASYRIAEHSMVLIASLFALTSGSIIFDIWENKGENASKEVMHNITRLYIMVGIPVAVGLCALAKPIITILTGTQFHQGYKIVPLVVAGAFMLGLQQRFHAGLFFHKKNKYIMLSIFISGLANLGLNFLLVPQYGYMAAATTTLISYCILLLCVILTSRLIFIWQFPFRTLLRTTGAAVIMGTIVHYIGNEGFSIPIIGILASIAAGIFIYILCLYFLNEFSLEEKKSIKNIWGKSIVFLTHSRRY